MYYFVQGTAFLHRGVTNSNSYSFLLPFVLANIFVYWFLHIGINSGCELFLGSKTVRTISRVILSCYFLDYLL